MSATVRTRSWRRRLLWLVAAAAALIVAGGVAYASVPDSAGVIHGCRNNESGIVKISESGQCKESETAFDWVQSAGYEAWKVTPVEITEVGGTGQHVLTLDLPPGSYQVSSLVHVAKADGSGILACFPFTAPDFATTFHIASLGTAAGDVKEASLSGTGLVSLPGGGSVELRCRQRVSPAPTGSNPVVRTADITAVRIGTVTQGAGS